MKRDGDKWSSCFNLCEYVKKPIYFSLITNEYHTPDISLRTMSIQFSKKPNFLRTNVTKCQDILSYTFAISNLIMILSLCWDEIWIE